MSVRQRRLRTSLTQLIVTATMMVITLTAVMLTVYRLPQLGERADEQAADAVRRGAQALDHLLGVREVSLSPLVRLLANGEVEAARQLLTAWPESFAGFHAVYVVDSSGRVRFGIETGGGAARAIAQDWSVDGSRLFRRALNATDSVWEENYPSLVSGWRTPGVGMRAGGYVVIGELATAVLMQQLRTLIGPSSHPLLVLDSRGDWVLDNFDGQDLRLRSWAADPVLRAVWRGEALPQSASLQGVAVRPVVASDTHLGWTLIGGAPIGLANPDIRMMIWLLLGAVSLSALSALILGPLWARQLERPLARLIRLSREVASGRQRTPWRAQKILELDELAADLERTAAIIEARERELRLSEQRLTDTFELSPTVAIQWIDREGRVLRWNRGSEIMYGYSAAEAVGARLDALMFSAEQFREFLALLGRVEQSRGSEGPFEAVIAHRDGTPRHILYTTYGIPDDHGGLQFVCMDLDITSLRRSQAEEAAREEELQLIFNLSPAPMTVSTPVDGEFRVLAVNEACLQQFGFSRAELIGKTGLQIGLWANVEERERFIARVRAQGQVKDFEAWMRARDDRRMLCTVSGALATIGGRELLILVIVDVTEARRMQDELRALNDELEQRVAARTEALARAHEEVAAALASLRQTQDQLVQSETLAALGRLVAGVAHELNTPIGNALMAVSTLRESSQQFQREIDRGLRKSVLEAFVRDLTTGLEISERNMHKAGELIASFKQVAVDQTSSQRRRFEVQEIVSETLMTLHPTLKRTPYRVQADIEPGLWMDSYPGPLGQVLANLINNAVMHAFDGRDHGTVRITAQAREENGGVRIRVADDGSGIPEEARKRVFEPFYTTRLGRGGTGLGLHIVHANVTRVLGGTVRLVDDATGGAVFELELPQVAP